MKALLGIYSSYFVESRQYFTPVCILIDRRSVMQCLEQKVTPLLAGLVAYADTNANLDLLQPSTDQDDPKPNWVTSLWLDMFSDSKVTRLDFR